ncbi:D-malate degradation protein R [Serratia entomophila]|nr:D-malate degradation protein R [Serratia entomophila]CAI1630224.1 D-malate degradation protein R [Serratia entomophila]CAI1639980.1 D-malate degradation protein R [Serratia entomophila]CAI1707857.1 D-malate degradation protein R [Serratia entomophila]CAI1801118.1 D-malate degradation protein R [Serratia entomophila]
MKQMPLDNLTDLLVFVRVADACSFTLAAEKLGISRSLAGKCLNRLEERLATRLLHRTTRSVRLTEDGQVFYEHALRILSEVDEAETAINTRRRTPRGRLRLDLPVAFGRLHILPILGEFLRQWPEVDVDVTFSDDYSDLVRDGIDLAIRIAGNDDSRLVRKVLAPHRLITCASPDYLAQRGEPQTPDELADHHTLLFTHQGVPAPWRYELNGLQREYQIRGRTRFNNVEALRDSAIAGAGLCQVGAFLVGEQIAAGTLVPVLERYCRRGPPICAVYPTRRYLSPKVQRFLEAIERRWQGKAIWEAA